MIVDFLLGSEPKGFGVSMIHLMVIQLIGLVLILNPPKIVPGRLPLSQDNQP